MRATIGEMLDVVFLTTALPEGDAPPTEFQIFHAGVNDTEKGPFLFDAQAAADVMSAFGKWGVDRLMIDLEHESLGEPVRSDSKDARGWAKLQLRPDGSLWAVDVRWTPDGIERLASRKQRFISPAFGGVADPATGAKRIKELLNCALVAMPATRNAVALVAASRASLARSKVRATVLSNAMLSPEQMKKVLEILTAEDKDGAMALLKELAVGGGTEPAPEGVAAGVAPTAESPDEKPVAAALCKLTGKATLAEAFESLGASLTQVAEINTERASLDAIQRTELVGELVKLRAETPATAYEGEGDKRKLCARLSAEPLASMRDRVKVLRASAPAEVVEPKAKSVAAGVETLSASEIAACKRRGIEPADFAQRKANAVKRA